MLKRACVLMLVLPLVAGCSDDDSTPGTGTGGSSTTQTGTGGAGGSGATSATGGSSQGGAGGAVSSGGTSACPESEPTHTDTCDQPELACSYGTACCACTDITCAVLWLCADPTDNEAGCPTQAPQPSTACDSDLGCLYCIGDKPVLMICHQAQWTEGAQIGCV